MHEYLGFNSSNNSTFISCLPSSFNFFTVELSKTIKKPQNTDLDELYLKVPYYEKHVFSGFYIHKLVLPEPANSQNEENK